MKGYALWLLARRRGAAALAVVLLVAAAACLPRLRLDLSITPILAAEPAAQARLAEFDLILPPRRSDVTAILTWPAPIEAAELARVAVADAALEARPEVTAVTSLADALVVREVAGVPAEFRSMRDVGILLNAVVLTALLADLFLLPLLLEWGFTRRRSPSASPPGPSPGT